MVGLVKPRLNQEQVLRIANVLLQARRHGSERLEQAREDALVGRRDRVCGIHQIKVDGPVIGVDDDLHRIADVVKIEVLRGLCIGKIIARRIGILHPEQPPVADHQIGVVVEAQERGDRAHPFLDIAADHNSTVAGVVAREQQVNVVEVIGEEQDFVPDRIDQRRQRHRRPGMTWFENKVS